MLRSLMTISGFTLMSRVLGVARDVLIARFLGTGVVADAFFAAFRFPNMFRRIFGEGAFNSAFVPLFGKRVAEDGRFSAMQFANNAFSFLFVVLGLLTLLLIPVMSALMLVVVPGFLPKFDQPLSETSTEFRIPLRGARSVYFEEVQELELSDLRLVERGDPRVTEVLGEVFGGETQAQGATQELPEFNGSHQESFSIPLGASHSYAVIEGKVEGSGALKIYRNDPRAFDLTVTLSKITFVYLMCMALVAHLSGVLTTLKKFAAPAFSPVLLNLVFLIGLIAAVQHVQWKGVALAWCVAIGGVVQLLVLWWVCRRARIPVSLHKPRFDDGIKRLLVLMGPGVIAAGIQQINLLVGGIIASFQDGAISFIYYADRIYQLPLGMIGIAFGMVLLPEITRLLNTNREQSAKETMVKALEFAMLMTIPATIALMVIPIEIISLIFERGTFVLEDSVKTGHALAAFAVGLPGYVLIKVLQPGYFAREDTKSPMKMAGVTVAVNIVCSLLLFPFIGHVGIAIATSIAAWVNVILLWVGLNGFVQLQRENWFRLGGMVLASFLMAVGLLAAKYFLVDWLSGLFWQKLVSTGLLIGVGGSIYALGVLLLKVTNVGELKAALRR
jgi:putative peptidoglycan lipid II flippase